MAKPFLFTVFFVSLATSLLAAAGPVVEETLKGEEAEFQVKLDPELNEIKVVQQKPAEKPGSVKMRILRKNQKPLEVNLHLMERREEPLAYTGKASPWAGSLVGFELEFSFDKKTWKKLKKLLP